jgi:hypothetical protein
MRLSAATYGHNHSDNLESISHEIKRVKPKFVANFVEVFDSSCLRSFLRKKPTQQARIGI